MLSVYCDIHLLVRDHIPLEQGLRPTLTIL